MIIDITNPKICATEYAALTILFNVGEWAGGILVVAVGLGPDIEWLNSSIVRHQLGYLAPPFDLRSG